MTGDVLKLSSVPLERTGPLALLMRSAVWIVLAVVLALLPLVFKTGTSLTVMSLMGIAIIFALSYNILLGQTGMLSFGHAVYYGLGAYLVVHAINVVTVNKWPSPCVLGQASHTGLNSSNRSRVMQRSWPLSRFCCNEHVSMTSSPMSAGWQPQAFDMLFSIQKTSVASTMVSFRRHCCAARTLLSLTTGATTPQATS